MDLIKVSSSRGDYVLINLQQVSWATVDTNETGEPSRVTLHMMDDTVFQLQGAEAEQALARLSRD